MTHEDKILKVMTGMGLNRIDAEEKVYFLNWVERENEFLKSIYPAFKRDIKKTASFIGMCDILWNDESTQIRQINYLALN